MNTQERYYEKTSQCEAVAAGHLPPEFNYFEETGASRAVVNLWARERKIQDFNSFDAYKNFIFLETKDGHLLNAVEEFERWWLNPRISCTKHTVVLVPKEAL